MNKRQQYAIGQHDLCCEYLCIGNSYKDPCDTLFETVLTLLGELRDAQNEIEIYKHNNFIVASQVEDSSVIGGRHMSRCRTCKNEINLATNSGHAHNCDYKGP